MSQLTPPVSEDDHIRGPVDAPVTLVEYGDFECPHCERAHPVIEEVLAEMGDDVRFVYRHFPITSSHPHAKQAAQAAEAAAAQGKFWEMYDVIYHNADHLTIDDLVGYAEQIGIDGEQVREALEADRYEDEVMADFRSGAESGVNGTPTFFVNGERFNGQWYEKDSLLAALRRAT